MALKNNKYTVTTITVEMVSMAESRQSPRMNQFQNIQIHNLFSFNSSKTEVRFPVNIGITGHVATTGEVSNILNMKDGA